jgi:hypothetical protein
MFGKVPPPCLTNFIFQTCRNGLLIESKIRKGRRGILGWKRLQEGNKNMEKTGK